jgi:hypothetical protein
MPKAATKTKYANEKQSCNNCRYAFFSLLLNNPLCYINLCGLSTDRLRVGATENTVADSVRGHLYNADIQIQPGQNVLSTTQGP